MGRLELNRWKGGSLALPPVRRVEFVAGRIKPEDVDVAADGYHHRPSKTACNGNIAEG